MLAIAERRTGLTFNEEARELIGLASLGLPYLAARVAQHAALLATGRDDLTVKKADVREAIRKSRAELSGRISARTLQAISRASQDEQLIEFGKLAHAALRAGGVLPVDMVPADMRKRADDGSAQDQLIEPIEGDPLRRWHFSDDGASIYIWLSALCAE